MSVARTLVQMEELVQIMKTNMSVYVQQATMASTVKLVSEIIELASSWQKYWFTFFHILI